MIRPARRWHVVVAAGLLLALAVLVAGASWLRVRGLPRRQGSVPLPGLTAPVEVRWDRFGVPHLKGQSGTDLAAALGYLHANDRMTQMELGRRAAAGRLAEVLGRRALALDTRFRVLRLDRTAEQLWRAAGSETSAWLEAYATGVNAWLTERAGDLPPEMMLLHIAPEPWKPADSLGFAALMAHDLSFWQGRPEEQRFQWLTRLGPERTLDLIGRPRLHIPPAIARLAAEAEADREGSMAPVAAPGSNSWAVAASRSAAGAPLVANDPHLPLRLPAQWYEAHLRAPDYEVRGMTLPGMPGVVIGQSAHLAWAVTNLMLDDHDLFFEHLDPEGRRVRRAGRWVPIATETVRLDVRGGDSVELELRSTDIGPLLPAEPESGLPARSLAWTAYLPSDPLRDFVALARSRRVEELAGRLGDFVCPAQNLVVADSHGGMLYTVLGRLPDRRRGDGALPSPGWRPAYRWRGLLPATENPRLLQPPSGLLVTANSRLPAAIERLPAFGADFDLPLRAQRIESLLAGEAIWTASGMGRLQQDHRSLFAAELLASVPPEMLAAVSPALAPLEEWQGEMEAGSAEAAFAALFERHLARAVFADELDLEAVSGQVRRSWLLRLLRREMAAAWFDDVRTPERESRTRILERALRSSWDEAQRLWGDDPARWRYGDLHRLSLRHPLGSIPFLGWWLNRGPFPVPGSATTVNALAGAWDEGRLPVAYGPSMRSVAVVGSGDQGMAVIPGGQSGHPADPHYDDQIQLYLAGTYRDLAWTEESIAAATVSRLRLTP